MLSGLMFPLSQRTRSGLRWLSNLVWARYYIEIVRDVFLQGGGWPAVWHKVLAIGGDRDGRSSAWLAPHARACSWRCDACGDPSSRSTSHVAQVNWLWSPAMVALILKELNQIRRDRRVVMALVLPPILQLMLFGTVMSPEGDRNPSSGVVDASQYAGRAAA